ncbi:MAG TPA: hypothetical protein VNN80_34905 [Polyangiaceae bacterium]|jgi:hypothetical protein|nr:hypothetical protein [Polyangiaceae bacterium]
MLQASSGRRPSRTPRFSWNPAWALALALALACGSPEPPKAPPPVVEAFPSPPPQNTLASAPVPPILLQGVGFSSPDGALYDPTADVYLVSNVAGSPADSDNNGFISKVGPDGTLAELRWIDGPRSGAPLNAPKGMALVGSTLFVADIDTLRAYDRETGKSLGDVVIPGATFLSDVAAGAGGTLYVTDSGLGKQAGTRTLGKTGSDAVYRVDAQRAVTALAKGENLAQPSGLCVTQGRLLITGLGGDVYALDRQGQQAPLGKAPGALGGMVLTPGGRLLISASSAGTVFIAKGPVGSNVVLEPLITDLDSPGDLGYDPKRRQLIVPLTRADALYIQELPGGMN